MDIPTSLPRNSADSARDTILQKIDNEIDLPAMGSAVTRVVELASSDEGGAHDLAYFILSDVGLTQKILRLSNTVQYRTAAGVQVTTISRAIYLLGFDAVKNCALAMMLVERFANVRHSHAVRAELIKALYASVISREIARSSKRAGIEESAIAALFANIGQVLVAAYDYPSYAEIMALVENSQMTEEKAAIQVMGCGFHLIAQSVLRDWNIPESIVQAMVPLPAGALKAPKRNQEWMQQVASFGVEASGLFSLKNEVARIAEKNALLTRFGAALSMTGDRLAELVDTVETETRLLADIMGLPIPKIEETAKPEEVEVSEIPDELLMNAMQSVEQVDDEERHPSGKPVKARDRLLAGVQEIMQMAAAGRGHANDVMLHMLETLYRSMGFRFATICLKDAKTGEYRARIALGEDAERRRERLTFRTGGKKDLFSLAMDSDADLMISDASDPKIYDLLPLWHRELFADSRSFIVLPIVVHKSALGFFYADRSEPAPEGVPSDETAVIKILKSQVLAALGNK